MRLSLIGLALCLLSATSFAAGPVRLKAKTKPTMKRAYVAQQNRPPMGRLSAVQTMSADAPMTGESRLQTEVSNRPTLNRRNFLASWNSLLGARQFEDALANKKTQTVLRLGFKLSYDLTPFLNLKVNPVAGATNGHVQSDSATSGKTSTLDFQEASANLHDGEWIELSLGALNQESQLSELIIDPDMSFPAVRLSLQAGKSKGSNVAAFTEAAVPTSASLTSNSKDYEKTPSLVTAGVRGQYKDPALTLTSRLTYFQFSDLPNGIATDSAALGNTSLQDQRSETHEFKYQYRGLEAVLGGRVEFDRNWAVGGKASGIKNEGAPSGLNQASMVHGKIEMISGSVKWMPYGEYYRIEPDATVAYYNRWIYQTNRVGYLGGLEVQYKRLFKAFIGGGERDAVFESASQPRERHVVIGLETLDAIL